MKFGKLFTISALLGLWTFTVDAASLSSEEAANHVGETATICGVVASANYAATSRARPTFLNLDKPYPDQIPAAVISRYSGSQF